MYIYNVFIFFFTFVLGTTNLDMIKTIWDFCVLYPIIDYVF